MNTLKKSSGILLLLTGALALVAPQAILGLTELRWLSHYTFPGEALVGAVLVSLAYLLLGRVPRRTSKSIAT